MRTHRSAFIVLASLAACAGPSTSMTGRPPASPAAFARPESDPGLRGAPQGARGLLPDELASVRVRRGADGQLTIIEFLSPSLTESEQVALRLAFARGELRLEGQGASGEESWITNLLRSGSH